MMPRKSTLSLIQHLREQHNEFMEILVANSEQNQRIFKHYSDKATSDENDNSIVQVQPDPNVLIIVKQKKSISVAEVVPRQGKPVNYQLMQVAEQAIRSAESEGRQDELMEAYLTYLGAAIEPESVVASKDIAAYEKKFYRVTKKEQQNGTG